MNKNTVAVTGLGMMSGLGLDVDSSWKGILEGQKTIKPFTLFDPEGLPSFFGVELPEGAEDVFKRYIKKRQRRQMTRSTMISIATSKMAVEDADIDVNQIDPYRIGVVLGATGTGYAPMSTEPDEHRILRNMASSSGAWNSILNKAKGPSFTVSTACSSGTYALGSAFQLIASGLCDVVIAGSSEASLNYLDVRGFCDLHALSERIENIQRASCPFDKERDGFVMGEGGATLVLESLDFAKRRNARIYAEMTMPGLSSEAYNIISPAPNGRGMSETMEIALKNAGLSPQEIDYINAHGTSTPLNDINETKAIKEVFGDYAYKLAISSTKSMTGHCLSGTASMEAVFCIKALNDNIIPPTTNYKNPDPECDLDYVPNEPRKAELKAVMNNSFAFGGQNGVGIFIKHNE